jgi:hypothetical protein
MEAGNSYALPSGCIYLPRDALIPLPENTRLQGEGEKRTTVMGDGDIFKINTASGASGNRELSGFGIANEAVEGAHLVFDLQDDLRGLRLTDMFFGKAKRHLDAQSLNQSATGGTVRSVVIDGCEFTGASYASRMFRHVIGYTERDCKTHHNQAGLWLSSGSNMPLSIADVTLHGEFSDNNRYGLYAGGDTGAGEINGITILPGSLFERNWLVAPPFGTKGGDIILETTTNKKVLGFRVMAGARLGAPSIGQIERVSISPNGGGYIGPVHLGDWVQVGNVPLFTFANSAKLKITRDQCPVADEQTEIAGEAATIFRFQDRNGIAMQQSAAATLLISVVDAATGANSCDYILQFCGNSNGLSDYSFLQVHRQARGADVGLSSTPFGLSPEGGGGLKLIYLKSASITKVRVTVKCISAYNG